MDRVLLLEYDVYEHKGCELPCVSAPGDDEAAGEATRLWIDVRRARWREHRALIGGEGEGEFRHRQTVSASACLDACAFFRRIGLPRAARPVTGATLPAASLETATPDRSAVP